MVLESEKKRQKGSSKKEKRDEDKKKEKVFSLLLSFYPSGLLGDHFFFIKELTILMVLFDLRLLIFGLSIFHYFQDQ